MHPSRSADFALLVACCRWPLTPSARATIAARSSGVDWTRFVRLAARHRVEGIVAKALVAAGAEIPDGPREELAAAATRILRQNLAAASESVRLHRLLDEAGVRHLFVKGVTLGRLAYGDIARKAGWDIDLLVAPEDLSATVAALEARGYVLATPALRSVPGRLPLWHRYSKESLWHCAARSSWVELHTALTDNPALLPGMGPVSPSVAVEVSPGIALPTLARDELFAYLCVHGASSAWFRLKWIADLAALIATEPPEEVERLYRRAIALGAGRSAALALMLARLLFRPAVTPRLWRELRADRVNRWLVAIALRKLAGRSGGVELDEVAMGTATIHAAQLALLPGWRFKRGELARQLTSPIDRVATPLPSALAWLYPLLQAIRVARGG